MLSQGRLLRLSTNRGAAALRSRSMVGCTKTSCSLHLQRVTAAAFGVSTESRAASKTWLRCSSSVRSSLACISLSLACSPSEPSSYITGGFAPKLWRPPFPSFPPTAQNSRLHLAGQPPAKNPPITTPTLYSRASLFFPPIPPIISISSPPSRAITPGRRPITPANHDPITSPTIHHRWIRRGPQPATRHAIPGVWRRPSALL